MLSDAQWALLEPVIEACRPKHATEWPAPWSGARTNVS
jgi:hypothetical protein